MRCQVFGRSSGGVRTVGTIAESLALWKGIRCWGTVGVSGSFAIEMMRRHFAVDVFNHTGTVDLRFLRPVRPGDTITFSGKVTGTSREANGSRVSVDIEVKNQRGDTTGVGQGSAIVPNAYLPPVD